MQRTSGWVPGDGVRILGAERIDDQWVVSAIGQDAGSCPGCGKKSTFRHGWYSRQLQDLPAQGAVVTVKLRISRWQCRNEACERQTFVEELPGVAVAFARRTRRAAELVELFGHGVGGRLGERLMKRLGMPVSNDTILRHLKRQAAARKLRTNVRVAGIDEWSWRKGYNSYGTIIVDLERREIAGVLPDRSAVEIARWLKQHPEIEIVSRDRCGLYSQGAKEGAPQARQVADRFHLLQNLREKIETQLTRADGSMSRPLLPPSINEDEENTVVACGRGQHQEVAEDRYLSRTARRRSRQAIFEQVKALQASGVHAMRIAQKTGIYVCTIAKWFELATLPARKPMAPRTSTPSFFQDYLSRRWAEGCVRGKLLFEEIKLRGYTGSCSHLERLLKKWRHPKQNPALPQSPIETLRVKDPTTGWLISAIAAAALCIKPRGAMTPDQVVKVDALKSASKDFTVMRQLAMRFRGILRGSNTDKLDLWLDDADASGIYAMQSYSRTIRRDIAAVKNAITEAWSNGQTEGQINRLKALKRTMYGRAGAELLRARMLPFPPSSLHAI